MEKVFYMAMSICFMVCCTTSHATTLNSDSRGQSNNKWLRNPFIESKKIQALKTIRIVKNNPRATSSAVIESKKEAAQVFDLTGIWKSNNQYKALINQTVVKKGDVISDHKVLKITKSRVELQYKKRPKVILNLRGTP